MFKQKKMITFILTVILFIIEIIIVKYFYTSENLSTFKSPFWIFHEISVLTFIGICHFLLREDIGYYDIFLIFFPLIGVSLLLLDRLLLKWTVSQALIEEILYEDLKKKDTGKGSFVKSDFDVMNSYDLLMSDNIEKKKKFLFSYQPKDISIKTEILQRALLDENIDVIHYAATELNKIDTKIQEEINIAENSKEKDIHKIYNLYKKYTESGLLFGPILEFYQKKMSVLLKELKLNNKDGEMEQLNLYRQMNMKKEYEILLKKYIEKYTDTSIISEYLKFLYKENRLKEMISEYKKYSKLYTDIEAPYFSAEI